jgi:hypothetical protein
MSWTVNAVLDAVNNTAGGNLTPNTGALTSGRFLLLVMRTNDGGTLRSISAVSVGGQAATEIAAANLATGTQRWQVWYIASLSVSGAQAVNVTVSANTNVGCWAIECIPSSGSAQVGGAQGTVTTGNDSYTTTQANSLLFAFARANYGNPDCDNLGGGTIVDVDFANTQNFEAGGYTLDAGATGAKTISFDANNEIVTVEITTGGGGGGPTGPPTGTWAMMGAGI